MDKFLNFFMDESGARRPDRKPAAFNADVHNFFGFGGVLASDSEEATCRAAYAQFCETWKITYPLHSVDIRNKAKKFSWLRNDEIRCKQFLDSLTSFLIGLPIIGLACVIDRPGYDARYRERYGRQQWLLCKTAFCVAVERAAKCAFAKNLLLRVYPERCSKEDDTRVQKYYAELRAMGCPFESETSGKYKPLGNNELSKLLTEIKFKKKSSPMVQIADLYLWPMCKGGYVPAHRPYVALKEAMRLIDCVLDPIEIDEKGIKYSCFELVKSGA